MKSTKVDMEDKSQKEERLLLLNLNRMRSMKT